VVIAELLAGIESMPSGHKQKTLREAVEDMIAEDFHGQMLTFNLPAARKYARIVASRRKIAGRSAKWMRRSRPSRTCMALHLQREMWMILPAAM